MVGGGAVSHDGCDVPGTAGHAVGFLISRIECAAVCAARGPFGCVVFKPGRAQSAGSAGGAVEVRFALPLVAGGSPQPG